MYFADIASSLYFWVGKLCNWCARSIMAEKATEGNVENEIPVRLLPAGVRAISLSGCRNFFDAQYH
jgi:hypothetical protein